MAKAAIVLLADTETHEAVGRAANALLTAKEFTEAGDDVTLVFDGAGTKWVGELADPEHPHHRVFESIKDNVAGACSYCASAFGVKQTVKESGIPLLDEYEHHPSLRKLVSGGFQVVTF